MGRAESGANLGLGRPASPVTFLWVSALSAATGVGAGS